MISVSVPVHRTLPKRTSPTPPPYSYINSAFLYGRSTDLQKTTAVSGVATKAARELKTRYEWHDFARVNANATKEAEAKDICASVYSFLNNELRKRILQDRSFFEFPLCDTAEEAEESAAACAFPAA